MAHDDANVKKTSRQSLKLLGTVGEPINPEAWRWYHAVVGDHRCPIVDTWWQTETGGIMIAPIPNIWELEPGSATLPFFGIVPHIVDPQTGKELEKRNNKGVLVLSKPWPGIARTVYGEHNRYLDTYMNHYKGYYFTGDGCVYDQDGYYWITGRVDDVINKAGHRLGTAEIEGALVQYAACSEAAVVGIPDEVKGQGIFAYCTLKHGFEETPQIIEQLRYEVRKHIGGIAVPDYIIITPSLPKTRSGKIMRRLLRKIASGESLQSLGDTSTLLDPEGFARLAQKVHDTLTSGHKALTNSYEILFLLLHLYQLFQQYQLV